MQICVFSIKMHQSSNIGLKEFVFQCKTRLKIILDRLEWSEEATLKNFNTNSVASLNKVLQKPSPAARATYPESCISENAIVLETSKLQEILQNNEAEAPRNFKELQGNFSREQKLKIYEHVIENTKKLENNITEPQAEGEISLADILAQKKREEKRKKRKFRKSKPTHIEEVRCLVDLQMQALQQFMGNKINNESGTANNYSLREEDNKNRDKRKRYGDYYRREQDMDINDDFRSRRRSRSKEYDCHKYKRHKRSSSKELAYARKRHGKSRSTQRSESSAKEIRSERTRRRSRSNSKDSRKNRQISSSQRRSRSRSIDIYKERKKCKNRSYERCSRNTGKEISKQRHDYRSRSYERYSRRQETDNRNNASCYGHTKEKCNEKHYRKESESPESRSVKQRSTRETTKSVYCNDEYKSHRSKHNKRKRERS